MFLQAAELSLAEIKYYRNFAFTVALGNPAHDPFFSVENAPSWMTSLGYQLYVLQDDSVESTVSWNPEAVSTKDLKAYRSLILTEKYQTHPFFSLENLDAWINPLAFQASRAPSRASSRVSFVVSSRASSPVSFHGSDMHAFPPSSRASSPVSFHESDVASWLPSTMAVDANYSSDLEHNSVPVQPDADSDSPCLVQIPLTADNSPSIVPSTQTSANALVSKGLRIKITRQLKVDNLLYFTTVLPTFDVPRTPTAILLDLSGSCHLLKKADSSFMSVDRFIRNENQESWDGSGAHTKGDAWVHNFTSNPNEKFKCRRVLYHLNTHEAKLPKSERYIHTAMSKNGFRLVVTMHPQIVALIHKILSLNFDFTFKRVEGKMDEWEVVGLVDRVKKRYTLASLFCDSKNTQAFAQLFTEFFDAIHHVTGEQFKLAPFYPDARCRTVMLDGEVPQALGFGAFLATYNNPEVSQIWTSNPVKLLSKCLKTCCLHFERHIDELPQHIPKPVIVRLKSVMGLDTQEEIDEWHEFCGAQADPEIKNWYAHKVANPWILPSINKFLSQISGEDWDITPNHSNYVESAHAARNAETGIHMPLLTAILKSQECNNIKAQDLILLERDGMIQKRWNGNAEREKLAAQRKIRAARKAADRNDQITSYETLKAERDAIAEDNKASLERQKTLEAEIKSVQEQMKLDRHRSDLKEHVIAIRRDVDDEKSLRREWNIRRAEIIKDLEQLRKGGLAGARLKGRRPSERPSGDGTSSPPTVDLGPIDTGASTSGPHYDVESLGSEGDLFWEPELGTTHVATVHDPAGAGDQIYVDHVNTLNTFIPAENCSTVNQTELYTTFGHSILNFDSISPALNNHSPESQDIPVNTTLTDLNPQFFDEFLANLNSDSFSTLFPDSGSNFGPQEFQNDRGFSSIELSRANDTGLEYIAPPIDILNQSGSRASQELPPLPTPSLAPSLSPSPAELEEPVNNLVNGGPDHTIAPRDIDLDLNERNIISGKRQRTQSTHAADAAVSRPAKRGLCAR
ncbi:hypothetical protein C8J57DRAFT_1566399 [Mycena rebaudengoi]|nr:hypothetical protein C8J57DRAFT_1566399 [Mycena rebaudengoi]